MMDFYSLLKHHSAKIEVTCCFQLPREKDENYDFENMAAH